MNNHRLYSGFFCLTIVFFFFSGCSQIRPDALSAIDQKASLLADRAKSFNQHITASKGTGWIKLQENAWETRFKVAWAAKFPNKIRITFLLSGHPVETILANGETITFVSHTGEHSKRSYTSKDPNMETYIRVPVKLSEMILVLLGRLPVKKFDSSYFSPDDESLSTVILKRKWQRRTQSIHVDKNGNVDGIKSEDSGEDLLYDMAIKKYKTYGVNDIPVRIEISSAQEEKLILHIINFLSNPPIKESVFRLTESG